MSNEITKTQNWLSPVELKTRVERIRQVHKQVMREDIHYGKIFGAAKPSLWQPGAQILLLTFKVSNRPIVTDLSGPDEAKYRVVTELYDNTGMLIGTGVGEASSLEEKYMWREAVSEEEFNYYPEDRKRIKFKKGGEKIQQVRTNPADVANTILKMANKRSLINAACTGLGASEVFTQDAEDLPEGMADDTGARKSTKPPVTETEEINVVEEVLIKEGGPKEKPWTKYTVKISGQKYATFDKKLADAAVALKGKEIVFKWEQSGQYKNLVSIAPAPSKEPQEKAVMDAVDFTRELKALAAKLNLNTDDDINGFLKNNLKIESIDKIPADMQSAVVDLFNYHIEQAAAK